MTVWCLFVCRCDEYGCMALEGVYSSEAQAHAAAKARGWQCEDYGEKYNHRFDYYEVSKYYLDNRRRH